MAFGIEGSGESVCGITSFPAFFGFLGFVSLAAGFAVSIVDASVLGVSFFAFFSCDSFAVCFAVSAVEASTRDVSVFAFFAFDSLAVGFATSFTIASIAFPFEALIFVDLGTSDASPLTPSSPA